MRRALVVVVALALALAFGAPPVEAAPTQVYSVFEGRDTESGAPVLLVFGNRLTRVRSGALVKYLYPGESDVPINQSVRSATLLVFRFQDAKGPADAGEYKLTLDIGKTDIVVPTVRLGFGKVVAGSVDPEALSDTTKASLDAVTLGSQLPSYYLDAGHLVTGTLDASRLPSVDSMLVAGLIGIGQDQLARGNHDHDDRYYSRDQLHIGGGTINLPQNQVHWTNLWGVPDEFANGLRCRPGLSLDDSHWIQVQWGGSGGDYGTADEVARSDHSHDGRYPLRTELAATGTLNASGNPVHWSQLKGVPASIADGTDDVGVYTVGAGLTQNGNVISANLTTITAESGVATTEARGDHSHDSRYLKLSGGTLTGTLIGTGAVFVGSTGIGVLATATGNGDFGVYGSATGSNNGPIESAGVRGSAGGSAKYGVHGVTSTAAGVGVRGDSSSTSGVGILGVASDTASAAIGVSGTSPSSTGFGGYFENTSTSGSGLGLRATSASTSGTALYGDSTAATGSTFGVYGRTNSTGGISVMGECLKGGVGVWAQATFGGQALVASVQGGSGDIAVFRATTTKVARIDTAGVGYFNGGTQIGGADVAESVAASGREELGPGDVLVIDTTGPRRFERSTTAESPLVAGVFATKPGVLLRNGDVANGIPAEEVPLAVVGIVPCKVCDEGGPIAIGDLLVTASLPGHAERAPANARQGTLLGKALGSLDHGAGTIEVLLMAR